MAGPIRIAILANGKQAAREMNRTTSAARKMADRVKTAAKVGLVAAGAAAIKFGADSVKAASDAQQSIGATEQIFKRYAKVVIKRSNEAAKSVGLSANEYRELSNVTGAMLKSSGMPLRKVTDLTDKLNKRAADMAATFGGTTREAIEAVSSLLRGEADPIERYGVSIKQSDINARLAAKGLDKLEGAAKKQAEQQARLKLLFEQTADSAGQFSRESDTLAGQQQRLAAEWENIKVKVGTALLPVLTKLMRYIRGSVLPGIERLWDTLRPAFDVVGEVVGTIGGIIGAIKEGDWSSAWQTAKSAASNAWDGKNGIRSKVVGVIRDKIMPKVISAVENAKQGWGKAWRKLEEDPAGTYAAIQRQTDSFSRQMTISLTLASIRGSRGFKSALDGLPEYMARLTGRTYANSSRTMGKLPRLFQVIGFDINRKFGQALLGLPDAFVLVNNQIQLALFRMRAGVIGFFADASTWLFQAGVNIISGLTSGFTSRLGNFYSILSGVTAKIPQLKGPPAKDRKLLYGAGRLIMDGLNRGILDGFDETRATLRRITADIGSYRPDGLAQTSSLEVYRRQQAVPRPAAAPPGGGRPIEIKINLPTTSDPQSAMDAMGGRIVSALEAVGMV